MIKEPIKKKRKTTKKTNKKSTDKPQTIPVNTANSPITTAADNKNATNNPVISCDFIVPQTIPATTTFKVGSICDTGIETRSGKQKTPAKPSKHGSTSTLVTTQPVAASTSSPPLNFQTTINPLSNSLNPGNDYPSLNTFNPIRPTRIFKNTYANRSRFPTNIDEKPPITVDTSNLKTLVVSASESQSKGKGKGSPSDTLETNTEFYEAVSNTVNTKRPRPTPATGFDTAPVIINNIFQHVSTGDDATHPLISTRDQDGQVNNTMVSATVKSQDPGSNNEHNDVEKNFQSERLGSHRSPAYSVLGDSSSELSTLKTGFSDSSSLSSPVNQDFHSPRTIPSPTNNIQSSFSYDSQLSLRLDVSSLSPASNHESILSLQLDDVSSLSSQSTYVSTPSQSMPSSPSPIQDQSKTPTQHTTAVSSPDTPKSRSSQRLSRSGLSPHVSDCNCAKCTDFTELDTLGELTDADELGREYLMNDDELEEIREPPVVLPDNWKDLTEEEAVPYIIKLCKRYWMYKTLATLIRFGHVKMSEQELERLQGVKKHLKGPAPDRNIAQVFHLEMAERCDMERERLERIGLWAKDVDGANSREESILAVEHSPIESVADLDGYDSDDEADAIDIADALGTTKSSMTQSIDLPEPSNGQLALSVNTINDRSAEYDATEKTPDIFDDSSDLGDITENCDSISTDVLLESTDYMEMDD